MMKNMDPSKMMSEMKPEQMKGMIKMMKDNPDMIKGMMKNNPMFKGMGVDDSMFDKQLDALGNMDEKQLEARAYAPLCLSLARAASPPRRDSRRARSASARRWCSAR